MRNTMGDRSKAAVLVVSAIFLALTYWSVDAFGISNMIADRRNSNRQYIGASAQSPTRLFAALPSDYQEFGNQAIWKAARQCGIDINDDGVCQNSDIRLDIEWKAGSIIVTVHGDVSMAAGGASSSDEEDGDELFEDVEEDAHEDLQEEFSLTLLARTINQILDDDGMGLAIAEVHSIEVTTPGVSDELIPGTPQFDAFKGFEVIVKQFDQKQNKVKAIEGRLVERNDEFTIINIKGRMKKMKNATVQSVRLPKAKKEKGSR
uniref:Uncharacterized protein n=1 Tax=Pseudo-nitzschia delicatissima TaxID=44447 RepID=A0A7S0UJW7_9STRA|mmetsp:Transcript_36/g.80  ORF Transcript_36/g.80 Transcript_36/m.80 type:complete len:262 (+) Transcript_36:224-1009(+)